MSAEVDALAGRVANLEAQLSGLRPLLFRASFDIVEGSGSRTAVAYGDLTGAAPTGPELSGLGAGEYVFFFGAQVYPQAAGVIGSVGLSVNGGAVEAAALAYYPGLNPFNVSVSSLWPKTLTDGNNTAALKYASGSASGAAEFAARWLLALRVDA